MVLTMRNRILKIFTWLLGGSVVTIAGPICVEWFIEVAKYKGFYENAGPRWDKTVGVVASFVTSGWALYPLVGLAGFVGGLWTDTLLKRVENRHSPALAKGNDTPTAPLLAPQSMCQTTRIKSCAMKMRSSSWPRRRSRRTHAWTHP